MLSYPNNLKYFTYRSDSGIECFVAAVDIIKAAEYIKRTEMLCDINFNDISEKSFPLTSVCYALDTHPWDTKVSVERALDGNIIAFSESIMVHRLEDIDPSLMYSEYYLDLEISFCPMYDYFKLHDIFEGHKILIKNDMVFLESEASRMEILLKR